MQNLSPVSDEKDIVTKEYVDGGRAFNSETGRLVTVEDNEAVAVECVRNLINIPTTTIESADYLFTHSIAAVSDFEYLPAGTYTISYNQTATTALSQLDILGASANVLFTKAFNNAERIVLTFTVNEPIYYIKLFSQAATTITDFIFEKGSTAHSYVPYDGYDITVCGKNLLDVEEGIEITNHLYKEYTGLKASNYTLTINETLVTLGDNGLGNAQHWYLLYDKNNNVIKQGTVAVLSFTTVGETKTGIGVITVTEDTKKVLIDLGSYFSNNVKHKINYAQLEKGSSATAYEPYKSTTQTITPTTENPVMLPCYDGVTNIISPTENTVIYGNNDSGKSVLKKLLNYEQKHALSGTFLAEDGFGSSSASITIENLSEYPSVWAYIDGYSGVEFATSVIIPIAYLAKSTENSVKLAGGIPSGAYITSSGPQAPATTSGYITASVDGDVLTLTASTDVITIGNVKIVAM